MMNFLFKYLRIVLLLTIPVIGTVYSTQTQADSSDQPVVEQGRASFYSNWFNGRKTASGEVFNNSKMTAAHMSLPFGTRVRVTNLRNGRSAIVTINDRGPYVSSRIIDLSRAAAQDLKMVNSGVQRVQLKVLD